LHICYKTAILYVAVFNWTVIKMENKKENFKRIATNRTNKIIDMIRSLGNLTNTSFYEYTDEQIAAIFDAIETELEEQKKLFADKKTKKGRRFEL